MLLVVKIRGRAMSTSLPSTPVRRGRWWVVGLLGAMLFGGCSNPLRARAPGSDGATGAGGVTAVGGTGGLQPVTISLGAGGSSATGGLLGTGGVPGLGGSAASGGAVSTGGSGSAPTTLCTADRCLVTLASGRERIWPGIAVDGASVYWTEHDGTIPMFSSDDGRVMKVPSEGGATVLLASGQYFPSYIRVDSTSVYWTTWNMGNRGEMFMQSCASIATVPLAGGRISALAYVDLAYETRQYGDIAVNATSVYWVYQGRWDNDYVDGAILRVSLADGSTTTLASAQWRPYQIAVDGSSVYWVNAGSAKLTGGGTSLMRMPLGGGAITTLDASASGRGGIVLSGTHVYWTSGDGTVMRMPLEGGAPVTLASGQPDPADIAVDAASVYWTNRGDGTVMKSPLEGGTPTTLASGQPWPQALAVDATSVYWTTLGTVDNDYRDGTVMKLTPK
jgi:hypothetical protein